MRVVVATGEALAQHYFAARLASEFDVAGIVIYAPRQPKGSFWKRLRAYANPFRALDYIRTREEIARYEERAAPIVNALLSPATIPPHIPVLRVENINDPQAVAFVEGLQADVMCVNGTNLLREPMLALIPQLRYGIINLHTGLSPYSRGGNCNLFMLLEGHPELVGVTIHHIDHGVDSGDIIITARPNLTEDDTLYEVIEARNFRLGVDLMIVALHQLEEGRAQRVKQWEKGKVFLRKTGYIYEPSLRVKVNDLIAEGLIRQYLDDREARDRNVRLVGEQE